MTFRNIGFFVCFNFGLLSPEIPVTAHADGKQMRHDF